tara:strand:- start:1646 stop:1957 length:312 start_codon:yes stop_codon:yes gene_type:complete
MAEMLAFEAQARDAGKGLWTDPFYAVRDAGLPEGTPFDRFELVEGVVADVAEVDRRIYTNFMDMTATISPHNRASFRDAGMELPDLEGRPSAYADGRAGTMDR